MKTWIPIGLAVLVVLVGSFLVVKKVSPVSWDWWGTYNTSSGLALKGYDPVAYFDGSGPMQGSKQFTHDWSGATWQFSSAENKNLFSSSPESYAAQFGGFCSFGSLACRLRSGTCIGDDWTCPCRHRSAFFTIV